MKPLIKATTVLTTLLLSITSVTHAQNWRLIASSKYMGVNVSSIFLLDSVDYKYNVGSDKGSTYNNDQIFYDSAFMYAPDRVNGAFDRYGTMAKRYDANGRQIAYRLFLKNSQSSSFVVSEIDSAHYNADGTLAYQIFYEGSATLLPKKKEIYTYDAQGVLVEKEVELPKYTNGINDPDPFMPAYKHLYSYNANGQITLDSVVAYNLQNQWSPHAVERFSYNPFGQLIAKVKIDSLSTATPFTATRAYYGYTSGKLTYDSTINYSPYNGAAMPEIHYISYNSQGLVAVDTMYTDLSGLRQKWSADVYTYTTFNFVKRIQTSTDKHPIEMQVNYYYGQYSFPTGVSGLSKQNELIAYPVPSSNFLNLKWETAKPTHINARIMNLQGQVVKQWSDDAAGTYTKSIHVGSLPAGNYIVIFEGGGELLRKEVSILH